MTSSSNQSLGILGAASGQSVASPNSIDPFSSVVISDLNVNQTETVTVALSAAGNGTLSSLGGGSYNAATGVYTDTGTAAAVSAALDGLVFTPAAVGAPGQTVTTTFTITDTDAAGATVADNTTTVAASGYAGPKLVTLLDFNGIDGASPAGLTLDAKGDIFVVTGSGGVGSYGTLVELTPTGSGYNSTPDILLSFPSYGSNPLAPVVVDSNGNLIYGSQNGVFQLTKTSSGFAAQPTLVSQVSTLTQTSLVVDTSGNIYGTTSNGIFEIAQTTNGYNPTPIILGTTPGGLVGGPLFDSQGNIFALSTFSKSLSRIGSSTCQPSQ